MITHYLNDLLKSIQNNNPVFLPVKDFCVRKTTSVFAENEYWIYADVIPWNHKYWPDTYDTSIHAFSSPDCQKWSYHGEAVGHRENNAWDYGGVATPGAIYFNNKIYIFYSGREKTNGKGWRQIGMAIADHPAGPFHKNAVPIIAPVNKDSHLDDPIPIISENGKCIDLYFRQADHYLPPPNYSICKVQSGDAGQTWSEPITVLKADNVTRAYETLEILHINGHTILITFDHFAKSGLKTAFRMSPDGTTFNTKADFYLEDQLPASWTKPLCAFNVMFMRDDNNNYTHIGITREFDNKQHYNMEIYPII